MVEEQYRVAERQPVSLTYRLTHKDAMRTGERIRDRREFGTVDIVCNFTYLDIRVVL